MKFETEEAVGEEQEVAATSIETITFRWTGVRPLLMSNPQTVQISNEFAVKSRALNEELKAKRKKGGTEAELKAIELEAAKNDFQAGAYWDDKIGFYVTGTMIEACLRGAAVTIRKGKDMDRGVWVSGAGDGTESVDVPVKTGKRFKNILSAFEDAGYRFETAVKIPPKTGSLVYKTRPMIPSKWVIEFTLEYVPSCVTREDLILISESAGRMVGLGSWRPKFGRFLSEVIA